MQLSVPGWGVCRPGIVCERASNARGRFLLMCGMFYGKERMRKWGFLSCLWKAVDLSIKCEFIHIYEELLLNISTLVE